MIERLATWSALGVTLVSLGHDITTWGFWCVTGLFWAATYLARQEGEQYGAWLTANLDIEALKDIKAEIKKIEQEEENRK
jgi:hypothetical protein